MILTIYSIESLHCKEIYITYTISNNISDAFSQKIYNSKNNKINRIVNRILNCDDCYFKILEKIDISNIKDITKHVSKIKYKNKNICINFKERTNNNELNSVRKYAQKKRTKKIKSMNDNEN